MTTPEEASQTTDPPRRLHYYAGRLLSVQDLEVEQTYHRRMRYLANRLLGVGVVEGLEVTAGNNRTVVVSPGLAIDRLGREIVLGECVRLGVGGLAAGAQVTVCWEQVPDGRADGAEVGEVGGDGEDGDTFLYWVERPRVSVHAVGQAPADSVLLARLAPGAGPSTVIDASARQSFQPPRHTARRPR